MADIEHTISINAPCEKVWDSWDRFGDIARFNKGLRASTLLKGSPATSTGARRRCDLKDGKSCLMEEIASYKPQERMEIVVFDPNLPVKSVRLMLSFTAPTARTTGIDPTANFTMKYGPIGKLLKLVARKEVPGDITRLLQSDKVFSEAV